MLTVLTQKPLFSTGNPSDLHHLRHVQPRALGRKASDEFVVPCAAPITARFIAPATSEHGGTPQVSTQSKSPGSSGNTRA
jgi:hypothetical protein